MAHLTISIQLFGLVLLVGHFFCCLPIRFKCTFTHKKTHTHRQNEGIKCAITDPCTLLYELHIQMYPYPMSDLCFDLMIWFTSLSICIVNCHVNSLQLVFGQSCFIPSLYVCISLFFPSSCFVVLYTGECTRQTIQNNVAVFSNYREFLTNHFTE